MLANTKDGITIPELLVVMVVISVISLFLFPAIVDLLGGATRGYERADLNLSSQTILRNITEQIRNGSAVRETNKIVDPNPVQPGGWTTSDMDNVLIIARPATDSNDEFIENQLTGLPYQNEFVYYEDGGELYRRTLAEPLAVGNSVVSTCRPAVAGCPEDTLLTSSFEDFSFLFFNQDNQPTSSAKLARSVELTLRLALDDQAGQDVVVESVNQMTFRNRSEAESDASI